MMEVQLYDSLFCRLCAEENSNGVLLYSSDESELDLSSLVNKFLPLKVNDDGKLPRTICPGCNIQLQSTVQFMELVVDGQRKLREMWKQQVEDQKRVEKEQLRISQGEHVLLPDTLSSDGTEPQILIHLPDGTLFAADHSLALRMEGLEKPRRKRGRPPKKPQDPEQAAAAEAAAQAAAAAAAEKEEELKKEQDGEQGDQDDIEEGEDDGEGRRRRRKKIPRRFMEAVQGKELERIFREEGVIDEEDDDPDKADGDIKPSLPLDSDHKDEVIGHLVTPEGQDMGELVIVNRGRGRGRPRNSKKRRINFECEICGRGFQHRGRYIFHKTYHKGVKYECTTCQKQFNSKEHLELHHKTMEHTGEAIVEVQEEGKKGEDPEIANKLNCAKCNKDFQTKQSYEVHLKSVHEGEKPFVCTICSKSFTYQASLKYHILSQHETPKTEEEGSNITDSKTELKTEGKGAYECDICGKVLNHPSSVVYHKEAEHNDGRRFVCNKCGKSFKHKQLLQRHQLVHSEDRPFVCNDCGHSFKTKANWINHQSTHTGEKKFFCELCGHQFAHKTSLTLHYRWHAGHKPYECHVCHKKFSQNGNLQEHLRIHSGEKPFCCDFCGRKFTTSSQFKLHVKRHTGERPWKCEFCGKSFLHKDTWKCHTRRHKGEKPFQCHFCARGFTEQWALKKHMRLHTGEKPYSCNICGKAFADCSNLTKHKKVHRENKANTVAGGNLPMDRTVWNIIRTHLSDDLSATEADSDGIVGVAGMSVPAGTVNTVGDDGEAVQQIIYVSYQDPDDPTEARTLHIVDEVATSSNEELKLLTHSETDDAAAHLVDQNGTDADTTLDLGHLIAPQAMQVTDEDGNPIHFTMQDGRQLQITTTDGHSLLVTTEDGRTIPVQLTTPEGHPITTGFSTAEDLNVTEDLDQKNLTCVGDELIIEHDGVQDVHGVEGDVDEEQTIEFTTQDGQKLRLVTTYGVNQLQLPADFMASQIPEVQ